jgi:alkylresorcinol/alkylpyrone synthase
VLRKELEGAEALSASRPRIVATGEHLWRETERIMGWDMKHDGFGVVLSPQLPFLMRDKLGDALQGFLDKHGLTVQDFAGFLFHPGGRKVLETAQQVLKLSKHDLRHSWNVLRDYGNMSSATALFIMREAMQTGAKGRHLLTAFGPGFSAYFAILEL